MPEKRSCQEASIRPVYRRRPHAIVAGAKQEPAMPTPPEASPAKPAKPSAASRYLFVFLVGLVIGAVALVMILRTVEARKTWQDHRSEGHTSELQSLMRISYAVICLKKKKNSIHAQNTSSHKNKQ